MMISRVEAPEKLEVIVALYRNPPENGPVCSIIVDKNFDTQTLKGAQQAEVSIGFTEEHIESRALKRTHRGF